MMKTSGYLWFLLILLVAFYFKVFTDSLENYNYRIVENFEENARLGDAGGFYKDVEYARVSQGYERIPKSAENFPKEFWCRPSPDKYHYRLMQQWY